MAHGDHDCQELRLSKLRLKSYLKLTFRVRGASSVLRVTRSGSGPLFFKHNPCNLRFRSGSPFWHLPALHSHTQLPSPSRHKYIYIIKIKFLFPKLIFFGNKIKSNDPKHALPPQVTETKQEWLWDYSTWNLNCVLLITYLFIHLIFWDKLSLCYSSQIGMHHLPAWPSQV